jgi:hypothetical protein
VHKKILGFLYFTAAVLILVLLLKVTNWLPTVLQEGGMKKYASVEEVKSRLKTKDIYVPTYFPQNVKWPPSRILAQSRPYFALVMEFSQGQTGDVGLIISQVADKAPVQEENLTLLQIKERASYPLKGKTALLEVGTCKNDLPCSRISWSDGTYRITLTMKAPPFELIRISDSMIR